MRVRHLARPAEPYGAIGAYGKVIRVTPSGGYIPAQAFVQWDGFTTWERLTDLARLGA